MGLADEELVAGEADPGGVLAGVIKDSVFDLGCEALADGIRHGDGFLDGTGHGGDLLRNY